jgi:hypothetical protein
MPLDSHLKDLVLQIPMIDTQSFLEDARKGFEDKILTTNQFIAGILAAVYQIAQTPVMNDELIWVATKGIVGCADAWLTSSIHQLKEIENHE